MPIFRQIQRRRPVAFASGCPTQRSRRPAHRRRPRIVPCRAAPHALSLRRGLGVRYEPALPPSRRQRPAGRPLPASSFVCLPSRRCAARSWLALDGFTHPRGVGFPRSLASCSGRLVSLQLCFSRLGIKPALRCRCARTPVCNEGN